MSALTSYVFGQAIIAAALWCLVALTHWWDVRTNTNLSWGCWWGTFCCAATFTVLGGINILQMAVVR